MENSLYIELIRRVLDDAVLFYRNEIGISEKEILRRIREHIDATSQQHYQDEPRINYDDPLCRLGYLYRHATANATLFEWVLRDSNILAGKLRQRAGGKLHVCSVGGGPGTELLGLSKRLLRCSPGTPRKISFSVFDNISAWSETWKMLADACEEELRQSLRGSSEPPTIAPMFVTMDVLEPASYTNIRYLFRDADVIAFNYLFSENKRRLANACETIRHLWSVSPKNCTFVVIDRREHSEGFVCQLVDLFVVATGQAVVVNDVSDYLDHDEQTERMGELLTEMLGRPRVKFFTEVHRDPTVSWFEISKP